MTEPRDLLVIDVAHLFWAAWKGRSNHEPSTAPIDAAATRVAELAEGWPHVVLAVDAPPYQRAERSPAYKAHRLADAPGRDALRTLLGRLRAEGWPIVGVRGHEADDVCASIVAQAGEVRVTVVTNDKDLWTLIGRARVLDASGLEIAPERVVERFEGVGPEQLGDMLAIAGDAADGIPGVPGLGVKRAAKLLASWGSLDAILAQAPASNEQLAGERKTLEIMKRGRAKATKKGAPSPGADKAIEETATRIELLALHQRVHACRADVELSRELVRLRTDLPIDVGALLGGTGVEIAEPVDPIVRAAAAEEPTFRRLDVAMGDDEDAGPDSFFASGAEDVRTAGGEGAEDDVQEVRERDARGGRVQRELQESVAGPAGDQGDASGLGGRNDRDRGGSVAGAVRAGPAPDRRRNEGRMTAPAYSFTATDATRSSILLRAAFCGPTGSGKTKTALIVGTRMVERLGVGPLFVVDSENKSALRYAYSPRSKQGYRFKHVPMPEDDYSPAAYMAALDYCEAQGAGVVLIDSLSHAWNGINGVLELVDQATENSRSKNQFSEGWKKMTPVQNRLIQRILGSSAHVLFTLRAKVDWVMQENDRGRKEPVKVGLAPVQREGVDYEPDLFFDMTVPENNLVVSKSRCDRLAPGEVVKRPGPDFADVIIEWINDSDPPTGARTLGEAVNLAVTEGILAAETKDGERYKVARAGLITWCERSGVAPARIEVALAQFKERVSAHAQPAAQTGATA